MGSVSAPFAGMLTEPMAGGCIGISCVNARVHESETKAAREHFLFTMRSAYCRLSSLGSVAAWSFCAVSVSRLASSLRPIAR